jgi:hypothetical protein
VLLVIILRSVDTLLDNDRDTNNETSAARQQVLNKQIYAAVTANKHVPTEPIGEQQWIVLSTRSVLRCYNEDNCSKSWEL